MYSGTTLSVWLHRLLPLAVLAAGVLGFSASPSSRQDFPLDDAWIHRVYARSFAWGGGFAYNDGVQEAGATSPLWIVVSSPAHWLSPLGGENAAVVAVKVLGALAAALAVEAVRRLGRSLGGVELAGTIAACALALEPRLLVAALSGMEIPLLLALWLGATWAVTAGRARLVLVLAGLLPVARPEGVVVTIAVVGALLVAAGPRAAIWRRPLPWVALLAPSAAWSTFCRAVNDHWLPNTYYLKAQSLLLGRRQLEATVASVTDHGWASTVAFGVGLAALCGWLLVRRSRRELVAATLLLAAPLVYAIGVGSTVRLRTDGYYWLRYVDPAALALTAAAALGLGLVLARAGFPLPRPRLATIAAVVAAVALVASLPPLASSWNERRHRLASDCRSTRRIDVEPALWIREHTPADAVIGVNDAGALRYFGERETIDLLGLNNADVAFRRMDPLDVVERLDYLAVFPTGSPGEPLMELFRPLATFTMPLTEYTICDCPRQATTVVAERRRERRIVRD